MMMKWLDEGADLFAKLPYLSAFMGHTHFSNTAYYIHLLPENLIRSSAIDWSHFSDLIPEVSEDVPHAVLWTISMFFLVIGIYKLDSTVKPLTNSKNYSILHNLTVKSFRHLSHLLDAIA